MHWGEGISSQINTSPKQITCYNNWKAVETKAFALSYALVLFDGYATKECLTGYQSFEEIVDLYNRLSLCRANVNRIDKLGIKCVEHYEEHFFEYNLSPVDICKSTIHCLLHLGK